MATCKIQMERDEASRQSIHVFAKSTGEQSLMFRAHPEQMLLPLQGGFTVHIYTQGVALG